MGIGLCTIIEIEDASQANELNAKFAYWFDLTESYSKNSTPKTVRRLSLGKG